MSNTDNSNNIPSTTSTENQLDDLVSQLRQTINKSDWLTHNTSAKWEEENPELAKQWREAVKTNQPNNPIPQ
jgi:hypothetical protein